MDETSKWYNMRPTHSSNIRGYKQSNERLIVEVWANADVSHKFRVYIIGTAKKLRTFPKGLDFSSAECLATTNKKTA